MHENTSKAMELNQLLPDTLQTAMDRFLMADGYQNMALPYTTEQALRYGWNPSSNCDCGRAFTIEHALLCAKGGFPTFRHNEIRDLTACNDVRTYSQLPKKHSGLPQLIRARLDISANGIWGGRLALMYECLIPMPH